MNQQVLGSGGSQQVQGSARSAQGEEPELDDEELGLEEGDESGDSASPEALTEDEKSWVEGEVQKAFYALKDVPPELQPSFKEMKTALTKGFQRAASIRRGSEELTYKAGLLDRLVQDPRFQAYATQAVQQGRQFGQEGLQGEEEPDPERLVQQAVDSRIEPMRRMMANLLIDREKSEFVSRHPDYKKYLGEMRNVWKENPNSNIPLELAYRAAKDKVRERFITQRKAQEKVSVETPGAQKSSARSTTANSIREAALLAADELGMDRSSFG